jgi:hypothetical protein
MEKKHAPFGPSSMVVLAALVHGLEEIDSGLELHTGGSL